MTAMSTLAARRGVAMSQHIPDRPTVDRLPRRRSDQVQRVVGWLLVLAGLLTVVLAVLTASAAYDAGLDRIKQDAATRTTVVGLLLDAPPPIGPGPSRPTRVSYVDQAGRPQVGQVPVTGNLIAGTPVRVEVNGNGRVGIEPPTRGDAVFSAVDAGSAVVGAQGVGESGGRAAEQALEVVARHVEIAPRRRLLQRDHEPGRSVVQSGSAQDRRQLLGRDVAVGDLGARDVRDRLGQPGERDGRAGELERRAGRALVEEPGGDRGRHVRAGRRTDAGVA